MAFCWTTIYVQDLDLSLRFYQEVLGLDVIRQVEPRPGVEIAFLGYGQTGETQVELIKDPSKKDFPESDQVSIGFNVGSLHGKLDFLKALGIKPVGGILQPNSSLKFCYIKDPDGINVQLIEFLQPDDGMDIFL